MTFEFLVPVALLGGWMWATYQRQNLLSRRLDLQRQMIEDLNTGAVAKFDLHRQTLENLGEGLKTNTRLGMYQDAQLAEHRRVIETTVSVLAELKDVVKNIARTQ